MCRPTEQQVRNRAYELWEQRNRPLGSPEIDWLAAKQELQNSFAKRFMFAPEAVAQHAQFFSSHYEIILNERLGPHRPKQKLGARPCRFCGKDTPDVSFKKVAHAIPEAIGNKALTVAYECDSCNGRFSAFEDDFAKYGQLDRFASQVAGKANKVPSLKTKQKLSRMDLEQQGFVFKETEGDPILTIDEVEMTMTVRIPTQRYYPLGVFKALAKMALTVISATELPNFPELLDWLREDDRATKRIDEGLGFCCWRTFTPGPRPFDEPHALLFRRKEAANVPYCQFVLMFGNTSFQIVVPCPKQDRRLIGEQISYFPVPVFASANPQNVKGPTQYWRESYASSELTEEMKSVVFSFESIEAGK